MAQTALILGTVMSVGSAIFSGPQQQKTADYNASMYDQQAANIAKQQQISATQYQIKRRELEGSAQASAGANGVMVSGSVAKSISNSLTQLGIDESYNNYNLEVQKNQALNAAAFSRYQGGQAMKSGFLNAGSALMSGGSDFYSKYWGKPTTSAKVASVSVPNNSKTFSGTAGLWFNN